MKKPTGSKRNKYIYINHEFVLLYVFNLTEGHKFVDSLSDFCVVPVPLEITIFIIKLTRERHSLFNASDFISRLASVVLSVSFAFINKGYSFESA